MKIVERLELGRWRGRVVLCREVVLLALLVVMTVVAMRYRRFYLDERQINDVLMGVEYFLVPVDEPIPGMELYE